jgi:predicted porin
MKKVLLSAAVASTLSLASYGFADGPIDSTIYGKVNVSVVNADTGSTDQWKLNSNSSRLGVKGKTEIADGLYAVYKAEFEIAVDDGDTKGQTFTQRNIMAGIRGSFGTVWVGKHDSPTKLAQNKIDLFNDLEGDIKNTFEGENRVSNIVAYTSPNINGFATTVAMMPGEGADLDGDGNDDTGLTDGISYSVSYTKDNLYIAVAGDQDVDSQDLMRIVAQYKIDALKLGVMYQQNEDNLGAIDESGFFVSAAYSLDSKTTLKAQYGSIENDVNGDDKDSLSLGADYKLAKGTKLYVFYTDNEHAFVDESKEKDVTAYGLGMEHKF